MERSGLTDAQRMGYLIQFHVIELESYIKFQRGPATETSFNIQALASVVTKLHEIKNLAVITQKDIDQVIGIVQSAISMANGRLETAATDENAAKARIWAETQDEGRQYKDTTTNIPAAAAFLHIVDVLDNALFELGTALCDSQLHTFRALEKENTRLISLTVAQNATIARLAQENAELKV
ncbi:hypothetical protein CORC01_08363 [Colletotrichum orchidophilum]|uniref:Uncharacterized protein n=1 Tax=Colletotrichum orchidophilum TaxID=1209926 RepID=A0A1G4B4E5_9PEZI|nr:uncharacterized protein CORC01_08363 [Colletotrichum orchidophilum]OHE96291.1 hypothetical protein CORC01_08363 [Colletotrichum orchidophilum]